MSGIPWHDTLIAKHAIASHYPMRLDQLVSEYADASPWKIIYGKRGQAEKGQLPVDMSAADLARYNAADCRLTILAWHRMQADLEPERKVYEHDLEIARLCREMGTNGIGVDIARRDALMALLKHRGAALKGQMRSILGWSDFQPSRVSDVRAALFKRLRAKWSVPTSTGLPSTSDAALEAITGTDTKAGHFCEVLLKWRVVMKIRSTYLKAVEVNPKLGEARIQFNWKSFGTVSGRLASRFQSYPKYAPKYPEGRSREIFIPSPGFKYVYYDVSQAEMRIAAYSSADPVFMAACNGDVHANNAKQVFPEIAKKGWLEKDPDCIGCAINDAKKCTCPKKDPDRGKPARDIGKNLGFAISYCAEAETCFVTLRRKGFNVTMRAVETILTKLHIAYRVYFNWVESNVEEVRRTGFMRTQILGRIRWLGWYPKPTEVANFPIQSTLADIVNMRMIEIDKRKDRRVKLIAQVHDSCIYEVPNGQVADHSALIKEVWGQAVKLKGGNLILPIDMKIAERMSEL